MKITKIKIKNFKCFESFELELFNKMNILVGDNGAGKSTILEAVHIALTGGAKIKNTLRPYLFNTEITKQYIKNIIDGEYGEPPQILIEVFLEKTSKNSELKGSNNSDKSDACGVKFIIELQEDYKKEFEEWLKDVKKNNKSNEVIPIEYYHAKWQSFADNDLEKCGKTSLPKIAVVEVANMIQNHSDSYIQKLLYSEIEHIAQRKIAYLYRDLKTKLRETEELKNALYNTVDILKNKIRDNADLSYNAPTQKDWMKDLMIHIDNIPFDCLGKGEQSIINTIIAVESKKQPDIILLEEPENHLSHSRLHELLSELENTISKKEQIIISTHSSFVANKLNLGNLILLNSNKYMTFQKLEESTKDFFMKANGYNTLRLLLSKSVILVEGSSDELIVQKAYMSKNKKLPIQDGIDIISCGGKWQFKRFLEIAALIEKTVAVVADKDKETKGLEEVEDKYKNNQHIQIYWDKISKEENVSLEDSMYEANAHNDDKKLLCQIFGLESDNLLEYMKSHKTEWALQIFNNNKGNIKFPQYIEDAITHAKGN